MIAADSRRCARALVGVVGLACGAGLACGGPSPEAREFLEGRPLAIDRAELAQALAAAARVPGVPGGDAGVSLAPDAALVPDAMAAMADGGEAVDVDFVVDAAVASPSAAAAPLPIADPSSHVKAIVPPGLAAVALTLLPGWERDIGEAGTFARYLPAMAGVPATVLTFHYGIEDSAPQERAAYKAYLAEQHLLTVTSERQRGGGWLLEGAGADGQPAFRHVVIFGGKHLVCHGSLFRDVGTGALADLRDRVVIEARTICESITLTP